jgi:hypothetical protein
MTQDIVTIQKAGNGFRVTYNAEFGGKREDWRAYDTTETVAEIRAYVAATYPKLNPIFVIVEN